jgi:hypothetical protein
VVGGAPLGGDCPPAAASMIIQFGVLLNASPGEAAVASGVKPLCWGGVRQYLVGLGEAIRHLCLPLLVSEPSERWSQEPVHECEDPSQLLGR